MAGTPRGIMRWAADGVSAEDSRGLDDPASGCTAWSVGQCMPFVDMPWAAKPADPAASRARIGVDTDGLPYILWPDGTWAYLLVSASGGALTDNRVPVWDGGTGRMVDSRIQDTGSGAVSVLAALSVNDLLNLVSTDGGIGAGTLRVFKDTTDGNYLLFTAPGSPASAWAAALKLRADPAGPVLELSSVPAGGTSAVWVDGVPLGSAAFADTGDFDAAGAAATAESNAESYADGVAATAESNAESYADGVAATAESNAEAYADANFQPLGTLPAADADSATLGGVHSITSANDTYEATGVIVTLPSAGTYIVSGCARGTTQFSAGGSGALLAKLRDTTNAADLPNTVTRFAVGTLTGTRFDGNALLMSDPFTVAGSTDVELYVASTGAGTWTTRQVSTELTKVVAWKIGD